MSTMFNRYLIQTATLTLLCLAGGCSSEPPGDSSLSWELIRNNRGMMPKVRNGSISACPVSRESEQLLPAAVRAVQTWLQPLQKYGVNVSVQRGCPGDFSINYSASVTRAHAYVKAYPEINMGPRAMYRIDQVMLHELGHAFGLSDTYVEGVWTCKPGQPESVMCKANSTVLKQDDIAGIENSYQSIFGQQRVAASNGNYQQGQSSSYGNYRQGQSSSYGNDQTRRQRSRQRNGGANQGGYSSGSQGSVTSGTDRKSTGSRFARQQRLTAMLDCNADYSKIRSGLSGRCINRSSGFCYDYSGGDVRYGNGQKPCN